MVTYKGTVETDPETGEQLLLFPDDMMEQMNWLIDDTLEFNVDEHNHIVINNLSHRERIFEKVITMIKGSPLYPEDQKEEVLKYLNETLYTQSC